MGKKPADSARQTSGPAITAIEQEYTWYDSLKRNSYKLASNFEGDFGISHLDFSL